eukprot:Seg4492.2 transcript_id=Seg4492.2/GoldUCD/mRNA.D3Y31 product="hypothetical protein" pseudo=true protein_id=Seg4492.2/GoldUCD/D3Y31
MPACKRRFCPHCNETVSKSTFYNHKDLYCRQGEWYREEKVAKISSDRQRPKQSDTTAPSPSSVDSAAEVMPSSGMVTGDPDYCGEGAFLRSDA